MRGGLEWCQLGLISRITRVRFPPPQQKSKMSTFNIVSIIPAKFLRIDDLGNYHLLCYFGFDEVREHIFNKKHFTDIPKSEYYLISRRIKNNQSEITILPTDEI